MITNLKIITALLIVTLIAGAVAQKHSVQQTKAMQEVLKDFPMLAMEIEELKKSRDPEAREEMRDLINEVEEMLEFKYEEPEAYERESTLNKLEARSVKLAEQLKLAGKQKKEQIRKDLLATLNTEFDLRMDWQKLEIEELENELQELRYEQKQEKEDREIQLEDRFRDVTDGVVEW